MNRVQVPQCGEREDLEMGVMGSQQWTGSRLQAHMLHMNSSMGAQVRAVGLLASFSEKPREIKMGLGKELSGKMLAAQA